jgi:2'-5' RNA ligase
MGAGVRAFVAVEVPAPVLPGVRPPSDEAPSHLTLLFLGDVPDSAVPGMADAFGKVVAVEPAFPLVLRGLGAFPSADRPRILFARIVEGDAPLARLHGRFVASARERGLEVDDRPFVPHLTVLRVRSPRDVQLVQELRASHGEATFGSVRVSELQLKSSVLRRGGAIHRTEARLALAGGSGGERSTTPAP